jgi:hypothetical protein
MSSKYSGLVHYFFPAFSGFCRLWVVSGLSLFGVPRSAFSVSRIATKKTQTTDKSELYQSRPSARWRSRKRHLFSIHRSAFNISVRGCHEKTQTTQKGKLAINTGRDLTEFAEVRPLPHSAFSISIPPSAFLHTFPKAISARRAVSCSV